MSQVIPGTRYIVEASTDLRIYRKVATMDPDKPELGFIVCDPHPFHEAKFYRMRLEPLNLAVAE